MARPARKKSRPAFQPSLNEQLERRDLMSSHDPTPLSLQANARILQRRAVLAEMLEVGQRRGVVSGFTSFGGQAITLTDTDGERYRVTVLNAGTVLARPMPGGRVALVFQGTGPTTEIEINNIGLTPDLGQGHTFSPRQPFQDRRLNVGLIDVVNGQVGGIFGFGTTTLSGPLVIRGTGEVDRIALAELAPGASVIHGGTLNQLEILNEAVLAGEGTGIAIGEDLNVLNVGQSLAFSDGASLRVGRDLGAIFQEPDGTGLGGQGAQIFGDLIIADGSEFFINRNVSGPIFVRGDLVGAANIGVGGNLPNGFISVLGDITP